MSFTKTELSLKSGTIACHVGGSGRPVLFLHSAGGVRLSPALERIAQSHRLALPVAPGFDGTPKNDRLKSMADLADLAAEVIEHEFKEPCDVIGHSFGGWTAAWLAVRHPDKVQQLVLAAPAGFRPEGVGGLGGDPAALRKKMFAHPENLPPEQKSAEVQAQNRAMVHHYHGETTMDRDLLARLKDISALTLILYGTKDGVIPVDSVRMLKERIPQGHLVYIYDAAHALDVDQPDRFARLVTDFLARGEAFIVNWESSAIG
jgi:pimeloyl-ACP methyl ester carboxylesterase